MGEPADGREFPLGASGTSARRALEAIECALSKVSARPPVVLIDGRSGAGKTTLARAVCERMPAARIIRLDDIYPGWNGLEAARDQLVSRVLESRASGHPAQWQRWDWTADSAAEWVSVDASAPLIVEGVGALSARSRDFADLGVWIELDPASRKARALQRDGGAYAPHWASWAAAEDAFIARENPAGVADLIVDGRTIAPE